MTESVPMETQLYRVLKQLGEGGYGTVQLVEHTRFGTVAYKTCPGASTERQAELRKEAEQHRTLHHPNVVILYETVFTSTCCGLFIEYMKYGPVDEFIKRFKVPSEWRIQILYETACGMCYLHGNQPVIIHGDLSSQNILIGAGFHAKIADFGLSSTLKENYESSITGTPLKGKPIYIAPEYFKNSNRRKSKKFDVYGFAISAWEILSQKRAYYSCTDMRLIPIFVERGDRPDMRKLDTSIPSNIKQLIVECWDGHDMNRPDFEIIKRKLFDHVKTIPIELQHSYISLTDQEKMTIPSEVHSPRDTKTTSSTISGERTKTTSRIVPRRSALLYQRSRLYSTTEPGDNTNSSRFRDKLPTSGSVNGFTIFNHNLYVVLSNSPEIDIYNIDTLVHRRKITVEGLVDGYDIVVQANWLHVSEERAKLIHAVELPDENTSYWFVNSKCLTMSLNKKGNIVVSGRDSNKIIEYTPTGRCVRKIKVDAICKVMLGLRHAIQLDDDQFLICHASDKELSRVCIIDSDGRMVKESDKGTRSGIGQMNIPVYLAIDQNGFILVADHKNNRIIQLNATLHFVREIIPASWGLEGPGAIHLHEKRLYVAESHERSIVIFDL